MNAPILIFAHNRSLHFRRSVESLKNNVLAEESDLYVFMDGPRNESDRAEQEIMVRFIESLEGFKSIKLKRSTLNQGLANSIIEGVSNIVNIYNQVIVLEDDMITSPFFLKYMNDGLIKYYNNEKIASIHGYFYPTNAELPETFFLRGADCWGWATWKRAWDNFERDGSKLISELKNKNLVHEFNFKGSYEYFLMLENQVNGINNSWAIRWYASAFLKNMYTLYPGKSLIQNIGIDSSGTHCASSDEYDVELMLNEISFFPDEVRQSSQGHKAAINFFKSRSQRKGFRGILRRIYRVFE